MEPQCSKKKVTYKSLEKEPMQDFSLVYYKLVDKVFRFGRVGWRPNNYQHKFGKQLHH